MEHRKHLRIPVNSLQVDISDGKGFYNGTIENISRLGLSVSGLPTKLNGQSEILTAIINGDGENFKMFLKPRWEEVDDETKVVGLEIESCSWGWTDFVMKFEPESNVRHSTTVH